MKAFLIARQEKLRLSTIAVLAINLCIPPLSHAHEADFEFEYDKFSGDLIDIIPSLYGHDGILLEPSDGFNHSAHFLGDSLEAFTALSLNLRAAKFPLPSASFGIKYKFDDILDEYVEEVSAPSASHFVEDGLSLGRGNLKIGAMITSQSFRKLNGGSLRDIEIDLRHADIGGPGTASPCIGGPADSCYTFEKDVVRLSIDAHYREEALIFSGAFGVTDKLDVGLVLPYVKTSLRVASIAEIVEHESSVNVDFHLHQFGELSDDPVSALSGSHSGIGDVFLRGRYRIWDQGEGFPITLALGLDLRLPTGNEKNLQGVGGVGWKPVVIASGQFDLSMLSITPHFNLGYETNSNFCDDDELDYAVGVSISKPSGNKSVVWAVSADLVGSKVVKGKYEETGSQNNFVLGTRFLLSPNASISYNFFLPVDDSGLRPNFLHSVGFQANF